MIHELDSVGKESSTGRTSNQTFLTVTSEMFLQFGHSAVTPVTSAPTTLDVVAVQVLGVTLDVPVEALSHVPLKVRHVAILPFTLEWFRHIWQDVPLVRIQFAW